jgi:hypothetical protein
MNSNYQKKPCAIVLLLGYYSFFHLKMITACKLLNWRAYEPQQNNYEAIQHKINKQANITYLELANKIVEAEM